MSPKKFRKKPVVIEAMAWSGSIESAQRIREWSGGKVRHDLEEDVLLITTMEGVMTGSWGDVIIKGVQDEFHPCKPDIFEATYEALQEQAEPRLSVPVGYIAEQRTLGWPDIHPEDYCHRCGGRNLSWWTDSEAWNAIMRPDRPDSPWLWNEIICPQCFAELWTARFPNTSWHLWFDPNTSGGKAFIESQGSST